MDLLAPPPVEFTNGIFNPTDADAAVILLHGLGDTGPGIAPVGQTLNLGDTKVRFVVPTAPLRPVTLNGGYPCPAWYDITTLDLMGASNEDEAGLRESMAAITALLQRELDRNIAPERLFLMGFSQGCAMTFLTGLRFPARLGGLVCLSGYLPLRLKTPVEASPANCDVPIFQAHGRFDDVVPLVAGKQSREYLAGLGYAVTWHEYDMAHQVCTEELADVSHFLRARLSE